MKVIVVQHTPALSGTLLLLLMRSAGLLKQLQPLKVSPKQA